MANISDADIAAMADLGHLFQKRALLKSQIDDLKTQLDNVKAQIQAAKDVLARVDTIIQGDPTA